MATTDSVKSDEMDIDAENVSMSPPLPDNGGNNGGSNNNNGSSSNVELQSRTNMDEDETNDDKSRKSESLLSEIDENQALNDDDMSIDKELENELNGNKKDGDNNNNDDNDNSNGNDDDNNSNDTSNEDEKELNNMSKKPSVDDSREDEPLGSGNVGHDVNGNLLPAFENVDDELLSFNSESDFAIFQKQLNGDIPLQRLVAVKRMVAGCPRWGTDAALSLIPRFASISNDKELVIRQTIAEQLGPFAKYLIEATNNSPKAHKIVIEELLPLMKDMLRDAGEIRQGAGNSLIMIAELLTEVEVHEHVLKIVLHMAHDDSDDQKITALPLLADLAPIVGHSVCRNYLSSDLNALSQDNSFRVRKSTVQYFGPICEQLGADDVEKALLPVFQQLCQDSIWSVRKGCVESFVDVANSVHQDTRGKLIPIMEKFLNDSSRWVRNAAYEHLGPFLSVLTSDQIKPELVKYFVNIPNLSSAEADADCSNHCAFNFPAVAQTLGPDRWEELNDLYGILVRKTFKSRKTLACSIHEICKILGTAKTERYLVPAIEFFLKDIDDIREGIIKNLWKLLQVFTEYRRTEYISQLWDLASESDVNWRFRLLLAQQLEEIVPLYPARVVYEQFVPLTFQLCNDRMADVRYAAVDPVKDLINCFFKSGQRESLEGVIKKCTQIRDGKTYAKRLLFIRICDACFGKIDKEIYDEHFFEPVLKYADDKIMNVRFCLARFIKNRLANDDRYKNRDVLKKAIEKLKNDAEDVEVRRFFSTEDEIEKFLRSYKSQANGPRTPRQNGLNQNDDMDDSDSSLYSTSDEEMPPNTNKHTKKGEPTDKEDSDMNGSSINGSQNENDNDNENEAESELNGNQSETPSANENSSKEDGNNNNNKKEDSSSDSYEDEDEEPKKKETKKLSKKLSKINLESAKNESNNPQDATGVGPDIADIGPDGRLVHQPTPFRLNIPADDDDDDDDNENNNNQNSNNSEKENDKEKETDSNENNEPKDEDLEIGNPTEMDDNNNNNDNNIDNGNSNSNSNEDDSNENNKDNDSLMAEANGSGNTDTNNDTTNEDDDMQDAS